MAVHHQAAASRYPDGDGQTLFDNTLLFWANDLGTGPHSRKRYPFLLATGNFTIPDGKMLETGRYLKYPGGTRPQRPADLDRPHDGPATSTASATAASGPLPGLG